ncbi:sensor histidine kinase [Halobacterium jilantaiense]|uniref:histidine kinase n=1 Tax=Halobacterium jilantaiense TaxID=355548 RepID=A0A1I0N979_9EURY|nr:PAS domain S-box protein [Halobacterium jilantaiense]SEV97646.1 PAS/PAC sensor signal transduction histidine kinase [Halobacterium jilantaiense]
MTHERRLLSNVRGAAHRADCVTGLHEAVCRAVVDSGPDYAYVYGPGVEATAGIEDPDPPETPPDAEHVETVDADPGREYHVPLSDGDDRHGTLAFAADDSVDSSDTDTLLAVGSTVALAAGKLEAEADNRDLDADLEVERRQFRKLHSIAAQMVGCEEEQSIYHLAIDAAENILEFDICGIDVARDGYLVPVALSTGLDSEDSIRRPDDEGIAGQTYQDDKRIIVDDVTDHEVAEPANDAYRSLLSVPIQGIGVFQAAAEREAAFSERDAELAELLMSHVGETLSRLWSDQALRESEQKYRTVIEQSHDAVTIHRDDGYDFVNPRGTELFGRDEDTILDIDVRDVVHPGDHEKLTTVADGAAEVGDQETFEARVQRPDGDVRHCEFSTTIITYQGEPAVLASIRDITERKERERELERQNERLDQFAGVVSHDLRSPLNVASGSLDLARETGDPEHFDRAANALDRMNSLVEDVLALARQGRLVDETEPVSLADAASDAWSSVDAPESTVRFEVDSARVEADHGRLLELFENLFRNAVEHGSTSPDSQARPDAVGDGSDGVTVTVSALPDGFAVEDDGPGIPEDSLDNVFERGFTSTDDGTGFGLAIVREIAEAHDWRVDAVPTDGDRGARFEVTEASILD